MSRGKLRNVTTICTPTYHLTRDNFRVSNALGWSLFILFSMAIMMLLICIFFVMGAGITIMFRNLFLAGLFFLLFFCLVCLFLVDILSSIDASVRESAELLKKIEEVQYNIYLISSKKKVDKEGFGT